MPHGRNFRVVKKAHFVQRGLFVGRLVAEAAFENPPPIRAPSCAIERLRHEEIAVLFPGYPHSFIACIREPPEIEVPARVVVWFGVAPFVCAFSNRHGDASC